MAQHPLKEWFYKKYPDAPKLTSHGVRNNLKRQGWIITETDEEVLVTKLEPNTGEALAAVESELAGQDEPSIAATERSLFALESHLRDYLSKNLNSAVKIGQQLIVIDVEYSTDVGPIDLLAKNSGGDYFVFELKLDRGADAALGQLLRYMGWCSKHLAQGKMVHGIVLAAEISDKLRYAASVVPNITLLEYDLQIQVRPVQKI